MWVNARQDKKVNATDVHCTSMPKSYASATANKVIQYKPSKQEPSPPASKYNIVLYGIGECPKGTAKTIRFKNDLDCISRIYQA